MTKVELVAIFRDVSKQAENYNMSLYEQLIQEGVEQGLEQGLVQGIKAMLKLNMTVDVIAAAMELPIEQVHRYVAHIKSGQQ